MAKDWQAVADAINRRLTELDMTQAELVQRAEIATETARELRYNLRPRRRSPRTLSAVSTALGWPDGHLAAIAAGEHPDDPDVNDPVMRQLASITTALDDITARLDAIERRLAADDAPG